MRNEKVVERIKTDTFSSISIFIENRAVYKTTWKNIVEPDRPQVTK
jgi:hypothetical protein